MTSCGCQAHGSFLTAKGLEEAAQRGREAQGNPGVQMSVWGPGKGSVSGLRRDETVMIWNEEILDEQIEEYRSSARLVS